MSRNYNRPANNKSWGHFWPVLEPDLAYDLELIKEWQEQHMPTIPYYVLTTTQIELDPVHQEIEEHLKAYNDALNLITYVTLNPTQKLLEKFGIDEQRDILLVPAVVKLIDIGLATLSDPRSPVSDPVIGIKPGDQFEFDNNVYEVQAYHREKYHANYNYPTYIGIVADKHRSGSFSYTSPVLCDGET